ncbi:MAG: ABC transporter permease [Saprospiraceae bacterium]
MFSNYLKIALRNMSKHKGYTIINLLGLTTGITICFLIFLWVQDEVVYDKFHTKADRIYRTLWKAKYGDNEWEIPLVPVPVAPTLEREFPEVEKATQFYAGGFTLKKEDDFLREQNVLFIDEDFFDVFTVKTISGDPKNAMTDPNAIILTPESAKRYFNDENPVGKTLQRNDGKLLRVAGVVEKFPAQSHFHFEFLSALKNLQFVEERRDHWSSAAVYTYFTLKPGASIVALDKKMQDYVNKNVADEYNKPGDFTSFPSQALLDIHLRSNLETELEPNGNITYVYLFSIIGFIILTLACINFVNLATARALTRAREVGIRKVLGSARAQLIRQFFMESFAYVMLSVIAAVLIANIILPFFNNFTDKALEINFLNSPILLAVLAVITSVVTILSGAFPALFLSSFIPAKVLKSQLTVTNGKDWLRKTLVVMQFCVSTALIIGTIVVLRQLNFVQNQRLGFDKEHILVIDRAHALGEKYDVFLQQLRNHPKIEQVTAATSFPGKGFDSSIFRPEQPANYTETSLSYAGVDEYYVDALKLELTQGRNFSGALASDSSAFLLNETAAKALGWDNPIGKELDFGVLKGPVVGVVKDFHFESLHHEVKPIVLMRTPWKSPYLAVRFKAGNVSESVAAVQNLWKALSISAPMEFTFLDEDYQKLYEKEQYMAEVFVVFSILAIVIACLGLFGLSAYVAYQRTKEIGIRKVLGANVVDVVLLLSKDFLQLVFIAALLAVPLAWWAMTKWLEDFAYRTPLSWWIFVAAMVAALGIALLTVSFQAIRVALANPVHALKNE